MTTREKFRAYWRLIFLVPSFACGICIADLAWHPTQGDFILSGVALLFLGTHTFRFAIGGALVIGEGSTTPLRMNLPAGEVGEG